MRQEDFYLSVEEEGTKLEISSNSAVEADMNVITNTNILERPIYLSIKEEIEELGFPSISIGLTKDDALRIAIHLLKGIEVLNEESI